MTVNLSIKNVPDDLAEKLRERAAKNHRSLQGELMAIVEAATEASIAGMSDPRAAFRSAERAALRWPSESARLVRDSRDIDGAFEETQHGMQRVRRLAASEILARARARNIRTPGSIVELIREMRDGR